MLDNCMNYLLSVSQHKVFKLYSQMLEEYDVTPAQAGILTCIWSMEHITPKEISQQLHLEAPTISGILDKMQKQGLVDRKVDPKNRRVVFVSATEKAYALKEGIEKATQSMNSIVLSSFSEEETNFLKDFLSRFIKKDFSNI